MHKRIQHSKMSTLSHAKHQFSDFKPIQKEQFRCVWIHNHVFVQFIHF